MLLFQLKKKNIFHSFKFNCNLVWYWNQWQYCSTKRKSSLNRWVEALMPMEWRSPLTNSMYMNSPSNSPWFSESSPARVRNSTWFSESSPARVRNSPWFSQKFPCYGFKIPLGLLTLSVSLEPHVGRQMLEVTSEMTQNTRDTQETDRTLLWPEEQNWAKN